MSAWKKTLFISLICTIFLLTGIMAMNYIVNPHGKYDSNVLPSLVWTGRSDKAALLKTLDVQPDILILGSSRSMKIDPEFIKEKSGLSSFNASVNSANAEDYYTMLRYSLDTLKEKPKYIILGIDIEAFHNNTPFDERLLFNRALSTYLEKEDQLNLSKKLISLLSYQETKDSLKSLYYKLSRYPNQSTYYDENGFLHYVNKSGKVTSKNYHAKIEQYIYKYRKRFDGYTTLSQKRKKYFEKFLATAKKENIQVIAFITTLHDDILKELEKTRNYSNIKKKLISYLNNLTKCYPMFRYEDFDTVQTYGGSPTAFYDGAHIHERNANQITELLLQKNHLALIFTNVMPIKLLNYYCKKII